MDKGITLEEINNFIETEHVLYATSGTRNGKRKRFEVGLDGVCCVRLDGDIITLTNDRERAVETYNDL